MFQSDTVDEIRKVAPEFFGQQNNTYLFIGEDFIESLFYFLHFMDNNALDACRRIPVSVSMLSLIRYIFIITYQGS